MAIVHNSLKGAVNIAAAQRALSSITGGRTLTCLRRRVRVAAVPEETIKRLYDAFDRHDGDHAAACYTDDVLFEDPAFGRLEHGAEGWAHWTAAYTFTGRNVVNDIRSHFAFEDDLIRCRVDSFSLRRLGGLALGRRGPVLATAGLLGRAVGRHARGQFDQYRR